MPSSPLSGRQRDALLQHLDSLFLLAQVISPDAERAVQLVEATYRRAFSTRLQEDPSVGDPAATADRPSSTSPVGASPSESTHTPPDNAASSTPDDPAWTSERLKGADIEGGPMSGAQSPQEDDAARAAAPAPGVTAGTTPEPPSVDDDAGAIERGDATQGRPADGSPSEDSPASRRRETARALQEEGDEFENGERLRIRLYGLMLQIRNEQVRNGESQPRTTGTSDAPPASRTDLADLRRRLADEFIDRALPAAFTTLPAEQRVLLMLCDVERVSCEDAGRVLGLDPSVSCARLETARVALYRALYADASDGERHLLETELPANWKRAALKRLAEARLVMVPPTLRPSVVSIFKDVSQPGGRRDDAREMSEDVEDPRRSTAGSWPVLLKKFAAVLGIIAVAGLLGYGFTHLTRQEPNVNLVSLSAQQAHSVEAGFQTTSAEQAERYIFDRLGSRVTLPTIADASLQGVSIRTVVDGAEVPVLLFQDRTTRLPITVYVYSYAFLDRHEKDLVLEPDILRQIESEGNFDLHDLGDDKALVWRNRDDIFIAITTGDADALRDRIVFPT